MIHILFVDDEPIILNLEKEFFEQEPEFTFNTATSVSEALTLFRTVPYDVIVSDYMMPDMDGLVFLKKVREMNKTVPFIFFTGKGNEEIIRDALNHGADFFLTKEPEPIQKLIELSQAIKLLSTRHQAVQSRIESEARFRGIVENSNAGIFYTDLEGRYLFANQAFLDLTSYTLDELVHLSINDISLSSDLGQESRYFQEIKEQKRTGFQIEKQFISKQRRQIWVDISVSVIQDIQGNPVHYLGVVINISDKKQMEKEITDGETQFQALINFSPIGISMLRKGQIEYVNQAVLLMFGYNSAIELVHMPGIYLIAQEEHDTIQVIDLKETSRESGGRTVETVGVRKDGSTFHVLITTTNVEIDGSLLTIAFFQDNSKRKEAEIALRKSEKHYRLLSESITDVVWTSDPENGYFTYVSPSVQQLRGYTAEEVMAVSLYDALTPESAELIKSKSREVIEKIRSGIPLDPFNRTEVEQPCKDGSTVWTEVITNYYMDEETGKFSIRGVTRDITQRLEADRRIKQSESALRTVLDSIGDAIFIHDTNGGILDFNAQVLTMFNISDADQVKQGSILSDYSASNMKVEQLRNMWGEVMNGSNRIFEWKSRRPGDDSIFDTDIFMTRIDLPQGPAILASVHDNTERKRVQYALEQANKKLNLLSSITRHDILNSLTAMLGYLELVSYIGTEGELSRLIQNIDTIARTIEKQINFTSDYQDMGVSLAKWQDVAQIFNKAIFTRKNTDIAFDIQLPGLFVFADPMLEKVIYNLIDNATRHGERVTEIRSFWYEMNDDLIWVVEDNGTGVSADMKELIFNRGIGKNTGLGLFLVREILSITGMSIQETGIEGIGARFEINIPKGAYRM